MGLLRVVSLEPLRPTTYILLISHIIYSTGSKGIFRAILVYDRNPNH